MMKKLLSLLLCCNATLLCTAQPSTSSEWIKRSENTFDLYYTSVDSSTAVELQAMLTDGMKSVTDHFGKPFKHRFSVYLFSSRNNLDRQWQQDFGDTSIRSQCWMVASGTGNYLQVLSPRVWRTEACEHDASDQPSTQKLITHELVHVYHGQLNPIPDFTGLDSLAWFIEGIATYVSGQVDEKRTGQVKKVIASGKDPVTLNSFWTGSAKYGLAGTLVGYIDHTYGRKTVFNLLRQTDQREMLKMLKTTEPELIASWKQSMQ
jgi:hypothetical protein